MSDYKKFFEANNPLNIYYNNINLALSSEAARELSFKQYLNLLGEINPKPQSSPKSIWEDDEEYNDRLQREEDWYQEYLRRLAEYNELLRLELEKAFEENLISPLNDNSPLFYETANNAAKWQVALGVDEKTGQFKHPELAWSHIADEAKKFHEYNVMYDNMTDLSKALYEEIAGEDNREYTKKLERDVYEDLFNRGFTSGEEDFAPRWNSLSLEDKVTLSIAAIGRKHLKGEALEEFVNADDWKRFTMLTSILKNSPYYESLASKHKKEIDWSNPVSDAWKSTTEHATNRFLYGITGGNGWDLGLTFFDVVGGGTVAAFGSLGEMAGSLFSSIGKYGQSRIEGMGFEEDLDEFISKCSDEYVEEKSQDLYLKIIAADKKEKSRILDEFNEMSKDASPDYAINSGTSLTELSDYEKYKEYAKTATIGLLYGEQAAMKYLKEFWDNTMSKKQTTTDRVCRTAGIFSNAAIADIAAFTGVLLNPLFMVVDHHNSWNPADWTVDGEGYTDALVQRNPILNWASDVQETNALSTNLQLKYKEAGVNALLIYKSTAEQNAFMSWNDLYDIIGLYGFTAATTLLSMGGSSAMNWMMKRTPNKLLRGLSEGATKSEVEAARRIASRMTNSETRRILKAGLAEGATELEITAALEATGRIASNKLYRGNLAVGAMMGTAEGALEAKSTYNTFMEDNEKILLEEILKKRAITLDKQALRQYMIANGYNPSIFGKTAEGLTYSDFTPEEYAEAAQRINSDLDLTETAYMERLKDDAADAAATNFLSNSFINGIANVLMKEAIMSRDVREASRRFKNKNKYNDLVDVVKKGNTWEAVLKKAVDENGKRGLWKTIKDVTGKTLKNAGGEMLEEYSQNLSDLMSRDALLYDLNQYIETVFDKDAREAFLTDWAGVLNAGLNSIKTNAFNLENIKAGVFGGLSSVIGGFSPAGLFLLLGRKEGDEGALGVMKWAIRNLGKIYLGGILEAIRDNSEEYQAAQRLVDATNAWLNTDKNQELILHLGGAEGFKKALENAVITGDEFNAHDSKLGLAIENAFMLLALKDTEYGRTVQQKVKEASELLDVALNLNGEFDDQGNYIGNVTEQDGLIVAVEDWVSKAINTFKNLLGEASRSTNLTDQQIVERIGNNAKEFLELQNEVARAQQRVKNIFRNDNLDPLAELAFVYALMSQQNTRSRRDALSKKLLRAINLENLDEQDKETFRPSGLNLLAIDFLVEHGTLEAALKKLANLKKQSNSLNEKLHSKKTTANEKREAKGRQKYIDKEIDSLETQIAYEKDRRKPNTTTILEGDGKTPITLVDERIIDTFSEGDIANMSEQQRGEVIANRLRYSKEQQLIIDNFLSIVRKNIANETEDIVLSNDEVSKDFIDLTALNRRADSYDRHLSSFINNPSFLSTTAALYREKERTRTLRYLYKEDLQLRPDESVLDFKERLEKKVENLKLQDKYEDANILNKLIHENKEVSKIDKNLYEVYHAMAIYRGVNKEKTETVEYDLMNAALLTLMTNSGLSMREIKDLLDKLDTTTIVKHLLRKTTDGQIALNKNLIKRGLATFDLNGDLNHDEGELSTVILEMKLFIDFYINAKARATKSTASLPKVVPNPKKDTKSNSPESGTPKTDTVNLNREDSELYILTPGNVLGDAQLSEFFKQHNVSDNLMDFDPVSEGIVLLAVIKGAKPGTVFAVLPTKSDSKGAVRIGNAYYKVLGALDSQLSTTLNDLGNLTYASIIDTEELGKLISTKDGPLRLNLNNKGKPKPKSNLSTESNMPLKLQLSTPKEIEDYAGKIVDLGIIDESGEDRQLKNKEGYRIEIALEFRNGVWKFPIEDLTLQSIIEGYKTGQYGVEQVVLLLGKNWFFKTYFDTWSNFSLNEALVNNWSPSTIYLLLLGDFIFLGYPNLGNSESNLNPAVDYENGKIQISTINKEGSEEIPKDLSFSIPTTKDDTYSRRVIAVDALLKVLEATIGLIDKGEMPYFHNANPLIGYNIILNSNSWDLKSVLREKRRIQGLIEAGVLIGIIPEYIDRKLTMLNPFVKTSNTEKNNNPNAASFDPAPKAVVQGGLVRVEDGTIVVGTPKSTEQIMRDNLNEKLLAALKIVDRIIERSKDIRLESTNEDSYLGEGVEFSRVTSLKQAYMGADTTPFDAEQEVADISHAYGNTVDPVIRTSLALLNKAVRMGNPYSTKEAEKLLSEILKSDKFLGISSIPNWSNYLMKKFLLLLIAFHLACTAKGWTIIPNDIKVFGYADVTNNGTKTGRIPAAGTLDLLVYDNLGIFHIIDIKTKHITDKGTTMQEEDKIEWEAQTSSYQELASLLEPGMVFGLNYIFPVFLSYSMPNGTVPEIDEDGMTVKNFRTVREPILKADIESNSCQVEDFLYEIDTLPFQGYEYSRLRETDKQRIIPTTADNNPVLPESKINESESHENSVTPPAKPPKPKVDMESSEGPSIGDVLDLIDLTEDEDMSKRTSRQAKHVEFVNNHIAPVSRVKLGVISRLNSVVKTLLDKGGKNRVIEKELANIFFEGDSNKMQLVLKGKKPNLQNLLEVLNIIKDYYNAYVLNRESYLANISRRHQLSKVVLDFLKGNITENLLLKELLKYNATMDSVSELLEFMASPNKEEVAVKLINKLETSKINTIEKYQECVDSITATLDNMLAKLDFLNSNSALSMVNTRVASVYQAIVDGQYEEKSYRSNASIDEILSTKEGNYGAIKLLRGIALRTKNGNFKRLANILLRELKQKNITLPIVVEDGGLNFIEGSTNGKIITIQKSSLDSYEHFERVLLHEAIHALIQASPEMNKVVLNLLDLTITSIQKTTGKTVEQIKNEYYGLTNVNEFISEFFTNYAFLETLKTIGSNTYDSIFDKFIGNIKERITGEKQLYSLISEAMENILSSTNIEKIEEKMLLEEQEYTIGLDFRKLPKDIQSAILSIGISEEEFKSMTLGEQEQVRDCCK